MNLHSRLLARLFHININNADDRNAYFLVVEMFWASILGSAAGFNAAFAIHLGAQNFEIGLLTSIPALMAVLVSIPAGRFLERRSRRTPWVISSLVIYRAGFLVAALAPWIRIPGLSQGFLLVMILCVMTAPAYFFNVGWIPLLADIIPENRRAAVFSARNIVNSATVSVCGFLFGQWLSKATFPVNYQLMYLIGFLASIISIYNLLKLKVPDSEVKTGLKNGEKEAGGSLKSMIKTMQTAVTGKPEFLKFSRNTLLHSMGIWLASPLYVLYFVRELHASDAWLGLNGMVASIGTIVGFGTWRWIMNRWGEQVTLKRTIVLIGLYPLSVGLLTSLPITPSLSVVLLLGVINGLISPGVSLSHMNLLLKTIPADARPSYTAIWTTIMNVGAFVCPLLGVAIAELIGLRTMLIFSGLFSVLGSSSFWWWPVFSKEEPASILEADS